MSVKKKALATAGTSVSNGVGFPASRSNTLTQGISDKRAARTEPADPAPTKEYLDAVTFKGFF